MLSRPDVRGTLFIIGTILCWATVPVLLKDLTRSVDAWTANGLRYPMAAILYWPVLVLGLRSGRLTRALVLRALPPAVITLCGQILWALAPYYLDASLIAFLIQASVVWAVLGAMILFPDERALLRSPRFYAGLLLAAAGFLGLAITREAFVHPMTQTGVTLILACSLFFGAYSVSVRRCLGNDPPLLSFGIVAQFVSVGLVTLMFVMGMDERVGGLAVDRWGVLAVSSLLGIGIAHVLLYSAIQRIGATLSNGLCMAIPFVTLVIAHFMLGESMSPGEWTSGGAMAVGGGLLLTSQGQIRVKPGAGGV